MPIDEPLSYSAIANVIDQRFEDKTGRKHGRYQFLWEIYILSRCIERLLEDYKADTEIQTLSDDFAKVFGNSAEKKWRIKDFLTAYKVSAGVKVEQTGVLTPHVSVEPKQPTSADSIEPTDKEISNLKDRVRKAANVRNVRLIVMIDRIDDFVVDDEYAEQRKSVQALVECAHANRFSELQVKIFLRTDLFDRVDFQKIGYDKIQAQIVRLEWSMEDISSFVARRLLHNFEKQNIKFEAYINTELLDADPKLKERARELLREKLFSLKDAMKNVGHLVTMAIRLKWNLFTRNKRSARATPLEYEASRRIVTFVLPTKVPHCTTNCKQEEMDIMDFLGGHFKLGGTTPNPRLVLMFLQNVFEQAAHYYERNPDKHTLNPNPLGEYELILREHIREGYKQLQVTARKTIEEITDTWKPTIAKLFSSASSPKHCVNFGYKDLFEKSHWSGSEEQFRQWMAFYTHIGLLVPMSNDTSIALEDRRYAFPTILQIC